MATDPAVALGMATVSPKKTSYIADWVDYVLTMVPHGTMFTFFALFWMLGG